MAGSGISDVELPCYIRKFVFWYFNLALYKLLSTGQDVCTSHSEEVHSLEWKLVSFSCHSVPWLSR